MSKSDLELKLFPFGFLIVFMNGLGKNWGWAVFEGETLAYWLVSICTKIEVGHARRVRRYETTVDSRLDILCRDTRVSTDAEKV